VRRDRALCRGHHDGGHAENGETSFQVPR
jgi:hypothetical protein